MRSSALGAVVRELEAETGASIEIDEADGKASSASLPTTARSSPRRRSGILQIAYPPQPEIGAEYEGEVVNITKFGAFVNILPGTDGLLHISKLDASKRVERVEDYLELGDKVKVRVGGIDRCAQPDLVERCRGHAAGAGRQRRQRRVRRRRRAVKARRGDRRGGGGRPRPGSRTAGAETGIATVTVSRTPAVAGWWRQPHRRRVARSFARRPSRIPADPKRS